MTQSSALLPSTSSDGIRKYKRVEITNLVAYSCYVQERADSFGHGVGGVINLSKRGILIETCSQINLAEYIEVTCMDKQGDFVRAGGRLVYSKINKKTGRYITGICFSESCESLDRFLSGVVGSYSLLKRDQSLSALMTQILNKCIHPRDERWGLKILRRFFEIQGQLATVG